MFINGQNQPAEAIIFHNYLTEPFNSSQDFMGVKNMKTTFLCVINITFML